MEKYHGIAAAGIEVPRGKGDPVKADCAYTPLRMRLDIVKPLFYYRAVGKKEAVYIGVNVVYIGLFFAYKRDNEEFCRRREQQKHKRGCYNK